MIGGKFMFDMITFIKTKEKLQYHIENNHREFTEEQWADIFIKNSIYKYGWNAYDNNNSEAIQFIVYFDLDLNLYDIFFNIKGEFIKGYQYHDDNIEYDIILLNCFNENKLKFKVLETLETSKKKFNKSNKKILMSDLKKAYSNKSTSDIFKNKLISCLKKELNLDNNISTKDIFEIEDAQNMVLELIYNFANETVFERLFDNFAEIKNINIGESYRYK